MLAKKNLKFMDVMHWHAAVSSHCEFFITNDLAFISMGSIEVCLCLNLHKNFAGSPLKMILRSILVQIRTSKFCIFCSSKRRV